MEAIALYPGDEIHGLAKADQVSGDIVQVAGFAGVVEGGTPIKAGDPICYRTKGVFIVKTADTTVFAEGDKVRWDDVNKIAVVGGTFDLGRAVFAKSSGEVTVTVLLNSIPTA